MVCTHEIACSEQWCQTRLEMFYISPRHSLKRCSTHNAHSKLVLFIMLYYPETTLFEMAHDQI